MERPKRVPLRRRFHAWAGRKKAQYLPVQEVGLVVRKPGYKSFTLIMRQLYSEYGITPLWSEKTRFRKQAVRDTYRPVMSKKPEVAGDIMKAFASRRPAHKNIIVELVHVPEETLKRLHVRDAPSAPKVISGETDPEEALRMQEETGIKTIRGEAFRQARIGYVPSPSKTNNLVHIPDPGVVAEPGWLSGYYPDLHVFVPVRGILNARAKLARLKARSAPKGV